MELRLAGIIWWKWHSRALGMDIFNRGEWLWNPTKLFVVGFFSLFWPWPCTKHEISSISFSGLFSLKFQKEKALGARLGIYFVNYDFCFQFGCHYICFRAMYYCKYTLINWCCCIFVGLPFRAVHSGNIDFRPTAERVTLLESYGYSILSGVSRVQAM